MVTTRSQEMSREESRKQWGGKTGRLVWNKRKKFHKCKSAYSKVKSYTRKTGNQAHYKKHCRRKR